MSQFEALQECRMCLHYMSGRYRNSPDIGTCAIKNKINGHDLMLSHDRCAKWESKDSGPIAGTWEYMKEEIK